MKKLLCLLFFVFVLPVHAQPERVARISAFVEGNKLSATDKQAIRQKVLGRLRDRSNDRHELVDLSGTIVSYTACPVGYVHRANYDISIDEIDIVRDEGVDCDAPGQCRAWEVEVQPEDEQQLYDFSIQLQCSADDAMSRQDIQGGNATNMRAIPGRVRN